MIEKYEVTEVSKSLSTLANFLEDHRDIGVVTLCYAKDQLRNFLYSLPQIITIIKTKTGSVFIPTVIQNSPLNPTTDMIIYLRPIDKIDKFVIDRELASDETRLAKSFFIR